MSKKTKKETKGTPVTVEELTALIVSVVDTYMEKKAKDSARPSVAPYVYHPLPHCPGCSCSQPYRITWSDGSSGTVSRPA